jgi:hypothetical protein
MKKRIFIAVVIAMFLGIYTQAQKKIYQTSGGETIISFGNLQFTDSYQSVNPEAEIANQPPRFTLFFHYGQYSNYDLNKNIGIFSGFGIRNIGLISDENLIVNGDYQKFKIIRRAYTIGIPLGLKLGNISDNFYLYGGGEYEWAFHFKEKYWESYSRSGIKTKHGQWFGNQVNTFLPSFFVGIQFPKGLNLKFKYYLTDFLNSNYSNSNEISDLRRYKQSQLMYISLTVQLKTKDLINSNKKDDEVALNF